MPYTLKQLKGSSSCMDKIRELKASAEDKGAAKIGDIKFNGIGFFHGLSNMTSRELDLFLSIFPQFPEILECSRKAAEQEKRRRSYEEKITKWRMEEGNKFKRRLEEEEEYERNKIKRQRMLTGSDTGEGTSQQ